MYRIFPDPFPETYIKPCYIFSRTEKKRLALKIQRIYDFIDCTLKLQSMWIIYQASLVKEQLQYLQTQPFKALRKSFKQPMNQWCTLVASALCARSIASGVLHPIKHGFVAHVATVIIRTNSNRRSSVSCSARYHCR